MSKRQKLINRLKSQPRDFTFNEAESLLRSLGFRRHNKGKTSGSRVAYKLGGIEIRLHRPHPQKELPMHQMSKLLKSLEREGLL